MTAPYSVDALGPNGRYRSRARVTVTDVRGNPAAELSLVPPVFASRAISAMRRSAELPPGARVLALQQAARRFASEQVDGLTAEAHAGLVSRISGLPISVVRAAFQSIGQAASHAAESAALARPRGALGHWHEPAAGRGSAVWVRRGNVLAVHAAGNHPSVHAGWLEALALGYRVAIRPSSREPVTPCRLVTALREAGFGDDAVALLPTDHAVAGEVITAADLAMVYGGDEVVEKFALNPDVLAQGPGRSKILIAGADWTGHLDTIVESVSHEGGTACTNATAVLVEGDAADAAGLAREISGRLAAIPSLPPEDEHAVLPCQPLDAARAVEAFLRQRAGDAVMWLGADGIADDLGDGSAALRPAVGQVHSASAPQLGVELPFPCAWVAPWSRADGLGPLRRSLVVTAVTRDEDLIDDLVSEPGIANVYVGDYPTCWHDVGLPHDGYLGEFLMRSKTVAGDVSPPARR
jgi:acyl-CoA reductase-like NAD-dependent aldehyde dehydrogenase